MLTFYIKSSSKSKSNLDLLLPSQVSEALAPLTEPERHSYLERLWGFTIPLTLLEVVRSMTFEEFEELKSFYKGVQYHDPS